MFKTIPSILWNDFYQFTMQNAVFQLFPNVISRDRLITRGHKIKYDELMVGELKRHIRNMSELRLRAHECVFMHAQGIFPHTYLEYLNGYQYDPTELVIQNIDGYLDIYSEGYTYSTMLWETPILALITWLGLKYDETQQMPSQETVRKESQEKASRIKMEGLKVADFGARRALSPEIHANVVETMKKSLVGTSNAYLAMKNGIKPIGTQAHKWYMLNAAIYGYNMANHFGLENWVKVYDGNLGIALPDTFTTPVFLEQMTTKQTKLFDGMRQDSASPTKIGESYIRHYKDHQVDPLTKTAIFSNALNLVKAVGLRDWFDGKIQTAFGMGGFLTNHLAGIKVPSTVWKLSEVMVHDKWIPVVKLSDDPGKYSGTVEEMQRCRTTLRLD
jgi:nicotinate phosphoribosyltransferase